MWQKIVAWFKHLFNSQPAIHQEKNGLWWQQDHDHVKVGLNSKVVEELGDITFLSTPTVDEKVNQSDQLIDIEGGKAVETFKSPVNGTISKVYNEYQDNPEKLVGVKDPLLVEIKAL
jgi:glycine cleavage system H protein